MKLSTKVRYGVRAMIDLAQHQSDKPVLVKMISERQEISKKYLESLLASLKAAGLLRSIRGAKGGYLLARDPAEITMEMIVSALDGPPILVECVTHPELCDRSSACSAHGLWEQMTKSLQKTLSNTTLADLALTTTKKGKARTKAKK